MKPSQRMPSGTSCRTVKARGHYIAHHCVKITGKSYLVFLCVTEEQNLIKELIALSTRDQIRAIRDLPMSFDEKKHIRWVLIHKRVKLVGFLVIRLTITPRREP